MEEPVAPSKVMDKKFIQTPEGNDVVASDEEWQRCGKWMIHHPKADLEFLDSAWEVLQRLLADGTIIVLKATTGRVAGEGVSIYCFTGPGMQAARRAATAIRMLVEFRGLMYYKTNEPTPHGGANQPGERLSIYMHTFRSRFYVKRYGSWVKNDEDESVAVPNASGFFKESFSGTDDILPSTYNGRCYWRIPKDHRLQTNGAGKWYLTCSCEGDGTGTSELDRAWLAARRLLDEGQFVGITLKKADSSAECAEIRLYVAQDCDVYSRLMACERIFKEASCKSVMYFAERDGHMRSTRKTRYKITYDYKFTPDGELYRNGEFSEEYIFG